MNKRTLCISVLLVLFSACGPMLPLQYQGHSLFKIDAGSDNPSIQTTVEFYNPNRIGATITGLDLDITVGSASIGNIQLQESVRVKRKQPFALPFSIATTYSKLSKVATANLGQVISGGSIPFALQGEVTLRKFLVIKKTYQVYYSDSLLLNNLKF